jgi:hypothetical protein
MIQESQRSNTKTWVVIGKASIIVALLIGVFQLKQYVWPTGPKLVGRLSQSEFALPPDINNALDPQHPFPSEGILFKALTNSIESFATNSTYAKTCASALSSFLRSEWIQSNEFVYLDWRTYSKITIRNKGNAEAEQLVLPLGEYGRGIAIVNYEGKAQWQKVIGSLELGSLRPGETISVDIWSQSGAYSSDGSVVLYSTGTTKLQRQSELFGFGASVGRFVSSILDTPILFIPVAVFGIFVLWPISLFIATLSGYEQRPNTKSDTSLRFRAQDAERHGDNLKYESEKEWENIGYWYSVNDYVTWRFSTSRPTRFLVILEQSCIKTCGGKYEIIIGSQKLEGTVQDTGDWKKFVRCQIGEIAAQEAGEYTLKVRATQLQGGALMNLRLVILDPVD